MFPNAINDDPPRSKVHTDDIEGEEAKGFGEWRDGAGMFPAHWKYPFNGNGVEEGSLDHSQVEGPEWTPDDFDFDQHDQGAPSPETEKMEGVETAEKTEITVHDSDLESQSSSYSQVIGGDEKAETKDEVMDDIGGTGSQEPSLSAHSPHRSFEVNTQSVTASIIRPESDLAMEGAASEEMGDDTANLAALQDAMDEDQSVANKDKFHEPAHDDIPIQAGPEPSETSSTAYNLASLGNSIATTFEGQSSTAGDSNLMQEGRKGPERSYMVISNRELSELAPDSKTDFDVKGKRPRKGTPAKYTR